MLTFATLGPEGSNHQLVARHYLDLHELRDARIVLVDDFDRALEAMVSGDVDHIIQVAVHPSATATVARAFFKHRIYVVDVFIAPSHPLAVLTRVEVAHPQTLALQPATKEYVDTSRWAHLTPETSIASVAAGLLAGLYDSGITRLDLADRHPGRFRIDEVIGTIDDPWIVYGTARACREPLLAWKASPFGKHLETSRALQKEGERD